MKSPIHNNCSSNNNNSNNNNNIRHKFMPFFHGLCFAAEKKPIFLF